MTNVWKNTGIMEKEVQDALDAEALGAAIQFLLWHVSGLKELMISEHNCNNSLIKRVEALEGKTRKAPNKDAAEMRRAASMLYARAKQLEDE